MRLPRLLLAAAAANSAGIATASIATNAAGPEAPAEAGLRCSVGALAAGGDIKRANMTIKAAVSWCENQPACAGFTANTNGTLGCNFSSPGTLLDMRFKDSVQGNSDPLWMTWTRREFSSVYFFCSADQTCSLCNPPNETCAKITYLAPNCFGNCNGTTTDVAEPPPPPSLSHLAPADGTSSCIATACIDQGSSCNVTSTCEPLMAGVSAHVDMSFDASTFKPVIGGGTAVTANSATRQRYLDGQIFSYDASLIPPRNATVASIVSGMGANHHKIVPADAIAMAVGASKRAALDFVLYPEAFLYNGSNAEWNDLDDPTSYGISMRTCIAVAVSTNSYVVCPFYELATKHASQARGPSVRFNTVVLLNRVGQPVGKYRKMYPTSELIEGKGELNEGIVPGNLGVPIFDTDVGRVAVLICWDMDFPELWHAAASQGAELIFWPSAGEGGTPISGYAQIHNINVAANGAGQFYDRIGRLSSPDDAWNYTLPPLPPGSLPRVHGDEILVTLKEIDLDETVVFYGGPSAKQQKFSKFLADVTRTGSVVEVYRDDISKWSMLRRGHRTTANNATNLGDMGRQGHRSDGGNVGSVREALRMAGIETRREESTRNRLASNQLRTKYLGGS